MQPDPIYAFLKFLRAPFVLLHGLSTWRLFSFLASATMHGPVYLSVLSQNSVLGSGCVDS